MTVINAPPLLSQEQRTFRDVLSDVVPFRPPIFESQGNVFRAYAAAIEAATTLGLELQRFARRAYDADIAVPVPRTAGAAIAARAYRETEAALAARYDQYLDDIAAMFELPAMVHAVGTVEWLGPSSCRFTYFDRIVSRSLSQIVTRRIRHVHELVNARYCSLLGTTIELPARAVRILSLLPKRLIPEVRVITGMQVLHEAAVAATSVRPTIVAAAATAVVRTVRDIAATTAVQLARRDPALCLGQFTLTGWAEGETR